MNHIFSKGIPCVKNWRFITLTTNHYAPPEVEYLEGKEQLRRFTSALFHMFGYKARWCWKMEFHEDGYAHWHMIFDYQKKLTYDQMQDISDAWGLGRVNVKRAYDTLYLFKYALKGQDPPEWFCEYYMVPQDKARPVTMSGVRFFQASMGENRFYTGKPTPPPTVQEAMFCRVPETVSDAMERRKNCVQVVATDSSGQYLKSKLLAVGDISKFRGEIADALLTGDAVLVRRGFLLSPYLLEQNIKKKHKLCQIKKLHKRNALKVAHHRHPQLFPF